MVNKFDFKKGLSSRAYTLMVAHRWRIIDKELFGSKKFTKRTVEQLQDSENSRLAMHQKAMEELTKLEGFSQFEAHKILQNECERLIKEVPRKLKKGEQFCGCCRVVINEKDWDKHCEDNKLLHDYLAKELTRLQIEQNQMRIIMVEDKIKGVRT